MGARAALLATLVVTAIAAADVVRRDELDAGTAARYLALFTILFLVRVAGQVLVWRREPSWLPPMAEWNLVPYRLLLPIQMLFLVAMASIALTLEQIGSRPAFGGLLLIVAVLYAGAMVVRYVVRMWRRPEARWSGGAIPIVFHLVLAAFVLTWGAYHRGG